VRFEAALNGAGASPLISAFVAYLATRMVEIVYYIPPIYHTIPVALDRYGVSIVPVSSKQPYEAGFSLHLPEDNNSVLFLTDPVWYAGTTISRSVLEELAEWQRRTSSEIFVDGSLQYLAWDGRPDEPTRLLDPDLTYRLVSPSKQLAVHGYRFAYLLLPDDALSDLTWTYANLCGPASAESIEFAHEAMAAVSDRRIPAALTKLAASRFERLVAESKLVANPVPDRAYSVFARLKVPLPPNYPVLDGRFFEQEHYPSFIKVNLLSPSIDLLLEVSDLLPFDSASKG